MPLPRKMTLPADHIKFPGIQALIYHVFNIDKHLRLKEFLELIMARACLRLRYGVGPQVWLMPSSTRNCIYPRLVPLPDRRPSCRTCDCQRSRVAPRRRTLVGLYVLAKI